MKTLSHTLLPTAALAALLLGGCAQTAVSGASAAPAATSAAASAAPVAAQDKSVPGDAAIPIVELMPLTLRYEADLKLTAQQVKALADFRKANMPQRLNGQKQLLALRGQLRTAMLAGQPTGELMRQITQVELAHMQARERCVQFMRQTLTPEQYTQLTRLYLDGLR